VARLRLFGHVNAAGRRALVLRRLNALTPKLAERELAACQAGPSWARRVAAARPFGDEAALVAAAERAMGSLAEADWEAAFAAHAKIGQPKADERGWSSGEQQGVAGADPASRQALREAVQAYEARFGRIFLTCATGKDATALLEEARRRVKNDAPTERRIAIEEQKKITRLRLEKLLRS
jgi:OHCU decarboxylase